MISSSWVSLKYMERERALKRDLSDLGRDPGTLVKLLEFSSSSKIRSSFLCMLLSVILSNFYIIKTLLFTNNLPTPSTLWGKSAAALKVGFYNINIRKYEQSQSGTSPFTQIAQYNN